MPMVFVKTNHCIVWSFGTAWLNCGVDGGWSLGRMAFETREAPGMEVESVLSKGQGRVTAGVGRRGGSSLTIRNRDYR